MKKINLILASALVMGALAVNGQDAGTSGSQDRTGAANQDRTGAGVGTQGTDKSSSQSGSQDQTGTQSGSQDQTGSQSTTGATGTQGTAGSTGSQGYQKDMIIIQSSEVPSSLRTTLGDARYKGWENSSTVYRSRNNDQFVVEMRDGNTTKVHRFDKDGKVVEGQGQDQ